MSALRPPRPPRDDDRSTGRHVDPPPIGEASDAPEDPTTPADALDAPAAPLGQGEGEKRFPCGQCGADLSFKPGTADLVCRYCGHANHIPQSAEEIRELDLVEHLNQLAQGEQTHEQTTARCEMCAAEVEPPPNVTAFACPFCGSNIVAQGKSKRLIKPKALLPFKIEKDEARARYRNWLRRLWFAPSALKNFARIQERLQGTYAPYWTYDARTTSYYTGQRGEHYYVTVGSGKNKRRERRTRWYPASGTVWNRFNDVLVLGSRSLPKKHADRLEPWGLTELVPYDDAYLSGFTAESYTIDLAEGFAEARSIMEEQIRATVRGDIGGDEQRIFSIDTQWDAVTFKHILLPIWISAYRFKDKTYRFLVNGRTGEVQGERPWSWVKIVLAVLAAIIVLGGAAYLYAITR